LRGFEHADQSTWTPVVGEGRLDWERWYSFGIVLSAKLA
jgi:hypothetical protein